MSGKFRYAVHDLRFVLCIYIGFMFNQSINQRNKKDLDLQGIDLNHSTLYYLVNKADKEL